MKPLLYYFIQVICISAILYGYYHLALRNKKFHRYNRFYLLAATFLSISIPFLNIPLYFTQAEKDSSFVLQTLSVISSTGGEEPVVLGTTNTGPSSWLTFQHISYLIYILIALIVFFRIVFSLLKIKRIIRNNPVEKVEKINFVETEEPGTPFSFFRWLFWNRKIDLSSDKGEQIFKHEVFHIEQKHSWDIMYMELLVVFCWFNPFFYLMKKEIKAIHEFLADQFAVKENKQWEYAELLLMQALSTQQHLVNPFFHNQIKRRIAMITTSQKPRYQYLRKILVLPVAVAAIALFAFSYKNKKETADPVKPLDKPITVVIDAGHGGEDAGAHGLDGTLEKDVVLSIAQKVKGLNEDKNLNILLTRDGDTYPDIKSRTLLTKDAGADLFISIHVNSSPSGESKGTELFIAQRNKTFAAENKILGSILLNYFSQLQNTDMQIKQRPVKIWVLEEAPCPAALIECGFISNKKDLAFMTKDQNQDKMAKAILDGIDQYFTQKKSDDWEARKKIFSDTASPVNTTKLTFAPPVIVKSNPGQSLVVIDGKIKGLSNTKNVDHWISPDRIESISVLKDASAIHKYGKAGEYGVIEITTKKKDTIPPNNDDNKIFDKTEVAASFPGGQAKWQQFLKRNLDADIATKNKAPDGAYTVVVQFIVDKEGKVSDVNPLTKHGYGMEEQATRMIKKGPDWIPAIQNGHRVKSYVKQLITFVAGKDENNVPGKSGNNLPSLTVYNNTIANLQSTNHTLNGMNLDARTLYVGINNSLKIEPVNIDIKNISATISQGEIKKEGENFIITVHSVTKETVVDFFSTENGKKVTLKELSFICKPMPEPSSASVNVKLLLPKISASTLKKASPYELLKLSPDKEILSYTFTIDADNGDVIQINNVGNGFTADTKNQLSTASPGKLITFDRIKIKENGTEKKMPSTVYKVIN